MGGPILAVASICVTNASLMRGFREHFTELSPPQRPGDAGRDRRRWTGHSLPHKVVRVPVELGRAIDREIEKTPVHSLMNIMHAVDYNTCSHE